VSAIVLTSSTVEPAPPTPTRDNTSSVDGFSSDPMPGESTSRLQPALDLVPNLVHAPGTPTTCPGESALNQQPRSSTAPSNQIISNVPTTS
jgi:hypothetical protein